MSKVKAECSISSFCNAEPNQQVKSPHDTYTSAINRIFNKSRTRRGLIHEGLMTEILLLNSLCVSLSSRKPCKTQSIFCFQNRVLNKSVLLHWQVIKINQFFDGF